MSARLTNRLKALRHPRMRAVVMAEYLCEQREDAVADDLVQLIARAVGRGDGDALLALASLTAALSAPDLVPYQRRRELYTVAKRRGHEEVARLFFEATATPTDVPDDSLRPERPLVPQGRPLTLGERKALARSHRRELLLHLLRDPHPDVVTILLENPHVTEREVLVLASKRPSTPTALAHVAANERWAPRYRVRLALVKNPYTPVPLAVRLATTLRQLDLRQIAADPHLAPLVREQARTLVQPR
ncbi:hypothetical protein [Haliangium sp.]|uniref:hypothetical protein n=1 Tax=Haliangium sp. TaxID=2663208 RepID=UPI003D10BEC8